MNHPGIISGKLRGLALLLVPLLVLGGCENNAEQATDHRAEASALVQQFAGQLKPRLQRAMAEGGPVHAIQVCAEVAPEIATSISGQSGWQIRRVSTRNRNPAAVPDQWEAAAIEKFEKSLAEGAEPATLAWGEMTQQGYRFAKAQVAEPLCLTCHGQSIAPDVEQALAKFYPQDRATGYQAGEIRGIFSVTGPTP